jgi:hypothetical protein
LEQNEPELVPLRIPGGWTVVTNLLSANAEYYEENLPERLPQTLLQLEKYPPYSPPVVLKIERTGLETANEDYRLTLLLDNAPQKVFMLASHSQVAAELEQWLVVLTRYGVEGIALL